MADKAAESAEAASSSKSQSNKSEETSQPTKKTNKKTKPKTSEVPRGQPKSNRFWKTPKTKFATIKKTVHRLTFDKKMELRNELKHIKEMSKDIKDKRKDDALQKHQRRVENAERRLANERRSEIVQVIKNPAKLRRMKRKQMRMIEKRDLSTVKVV